MGSYLHVGIIQNIELEKCWKDEKATTEEIETYIKEHYLLDLDLYNIEEDEKTYTLSLKFDVLENHLLSFLENQNKLLPQHEYRKKDWENLNEHLKDMKALELVEMARDKRFVGFQMASVIERCRINWKVNGRAYIHAICYSIEGKVIAESIHETAHYLMQLMRKDKNNPLNQTVYMFIE